MMSDSQPIGQRPNLGFGLGLRRELVQAILTQQPKLDWLEILSDSYLDSDAQQLAELIQVRNTYPLVMHGGALSIGGPDPLDRTYLTKLKALAERLQPAMISDHLCWTLPGRSHSYELRPLPRDHEMIEHLVARIQLVQESLGCRILLENISDPSAHSNDQMPEWEFVGQIAEASDSLILLDLNNIITNSVWAAFDPVNYINQLPADRVWEIHLAPMVKRAEYDWDADTHIINDPVWQLYREVIRRYGPVPTMLERNNDIPPLTELLAELSQARQIARQA
jgi:uncharacterized protein (UPF0276 family)